MWQAPKIRLPSINVPSHLRTSSHLATFCPICRRAIGRWDGPIWLRFDHCRNFVQSAYWAKCSQMGHPVCRRNIMLADGPSHLATFCPICRRDVSSANILPNLQTGRLICQHFAQSADILSNLHTGQNVPRWALPSADGTKCWQMGRPICRRDASPDGPEHKFHFLQL